MPAFAVAAGILLLLQSIELIFAHPGGLSALTTGEEKEAERSDEIAVFPLAIPLIAGPASITATMLLMREANIDPVRVVVLFLSLLLALALTYAALMAYRFLYEEREKRKNSLDAVRKETGVERTPDGRYRLPAAK